MEGTLLKDTAWGMVHSPMPKLFSSVWLKSVKVLLLESTQYSLRRPGKDRLQSRKILAEKAN